MFAQLLAKQLEHLLMVLTAESVKGRAVPPLLIQPPMLIASHPAWSAAVTGVPQGRPAVSQARACETARTARRPEPVSGRGPFYETPRSRHSETRDQAGCRLISLVRESVR